MRIAQGYEVRPTSDEVAVCMTWLNELCVDLATFGSVRALSSVEEGDKVHRRGVLVVRITNNFHWIRTKP